MTGDIISVGVPVQPIVPAVWFGLDAMKLNRFAFFIALLLSAVGLQAGKIKVS